MEEDNGLKRVLRKLEKKWDGLKGRIFRKGRTRVFPSASRIFGFLESYNSEEEEAERESTPEGKSKILPVGDSFKELVELNLSIVCQSQVLNPRRSATLDMDNNLIVSNKSTAKISYKKEKSYHPFNVYWAEQDLMLFSEFRDGNVPAGVEQLRVLKKYLSDLTRWDTCMSFWSSWKKERIDSARSVFQSAALYPHLSGKQFRKWTKKSGKRLL